MLLFPVAKECEYKEGSYKLPKKLNIKCESEKVKKYLNAFITICECENEKENIIFEISEKLENEEYSLEISGDGIYICGKDEEALFMAATTLKQIFLQKENNELPFLKIKDKPDIKKRGIMLDVSQGRITSPETLYKLIDVMADLKYNELQLYFDNIVFEYKTMSDYYKKGRVYSVEDIENIEKYCNERFIDLVPNQNSLGHMAKWVKIEEFADLAIVRDDGKDSGTIDPLDPRSLEFVDRLYKDLVPHFSSDKLHVGMDEPFELGMGQTKEECEKHGTGRIYTDYLKKICSLSMEKYKKRPMFWDDIIMKYPEYLGELSKDCIFVDWGYEEETKYEIRCKKLKESGFDYYVAPGTSNWGSITGRGHNMLYNINNAAAAGAKWGALGFLLTDWTDEGGLMPLFMSYLPYAIGAAYSWNSGYSKDEIECNIDDELRSNYRHKVLNLARDYLDKFVFKCDKGTFSHILYRLSNAHHLEANTRFNGSLYARLPAMYADVSELEGTYPVYYEDIEEYIEKRKKEARECALYCEDAELIKKEIDLLCDIAIFCARAVQICSAIYNKMPYSVSMPDAEELKNRFKNLWTERNLEGGYEKYHGRIDGMCEKIKMMSQTYKED